MVIVAGHITVEPQQRESYLAGCVSIVERARGTAGCLDFAITADLIDPGRVNIFERWESQAAVESARSSAPGDDLGAAMLSVSVEEYDIADVRPLFGEGPDMAIDKVLADVAVDDFASALTWYERLFGRPADAEPMDGLAEWHLTKGGGIQVSDYAERAGSSNVTLVVSSLDEQLAALEAEGIPVGEIQGTPGFVKAATVSDPEGNEITFAEDLTNKT